MAEPAKKAVIRGSLGPLRRPSSARFKLYIATPSYGSSFSAEYVRSLYGLLTSPARNAVDFVFSYFDFADVVFARNYLVSDFYFHHADCTHLLFIDDDMGYEPALISDMLQLNAAVAGTLYPKRKIDLKKLHAAKDMPFEKALANSLEFIGTIRKPMERKNQFVSVNRCGTGIMLISRACVEKMITVLPELVDTKRFKRLPYGEKFTKAITPFNPITTEDQELSEDFSFCKRWIDDCGGKVWAHTGRNIRHAGRMVFSSRYADL
jgi:hypothetical protein